MRFKISSLVVFSVCISFFLKIQEEIIIIFVLDILHEFGHVLMAKKFGLKVSIFSINIYGTSALIDDIEYVTPFKQILIYLSGPLSIIISQLAIFLIYKANIISSYYFNLYTYMNLSLCLFNLLPIYPLDGGRIFDVVLKMVYPVKKSLKIRIIYNAISISLLMILLIIKKQILMIIIFSLCLISEVINYYKSYDEYLKNRYYRKIAFEEKLSEYPSVYHFRNNIYFVDGKYIKEDKIIERLLLKNKDEKIQKEREFKIKKFKILLKK